MKKRPSKTRRQAVALTAISGLLSVPGIIRTKTKNAQGEDEWKLERWYDPDNPAQSFVVRAYQYADKFIEIGELSPEEFKELVIAPDKDR